MPVSQSRILFLSLLTGSLLSTSIWADTVVVNTISDENNLDNQSCSIREAINYLNAKNTKKAVIEEEMAVIAGTSLQVNLQLAGAKLSLKAEQQQPSPNTAEIARLQKEIADLSVLVNNSLSGLNQQLNETTDALNKEKNKTSPDNGLISNYETTITSLKDRIKQKETEHSVKEKELQDYRAKGLFGCNSNNNNTADIIALTTDIGTYNVDSPITISLNVTISLFGTETASNPTDSVSEVINLEDTNNPNAKPRTIIKASGTHNLFIIDDGINNNHDNNSATVDRYINVYFNNIDLTGCNNNCAIDGGIFFNKEGLHITNSVISHGVASNAGGAVYNAANAVFTINNSVIKQNKASFGGAIYSENANIRLTSSLVTENQTAQTNSGAISVAKNAANSPYSAIRRFIENTTFSANQGTALNLKEGIVVNNSTIVKNTVGIDFNHSLPTIYNTIIADNTIDCQAFAAIPNDNRAYFANNLSVINKGCPTVNVHNNIIITNTGDQTLMAATDNNGRCAAPPANGLLCPLGNYGGLTRTHKPRLLASYSKISDSFIVNKGFNTNTLNSGLACTSTDQRAKPRANNDNVCDIGAVEVVSGLGSSTQGDDIIFGQIKRFSPLENLGDGELLPAEFCPSLLGTRPTPYLAGCIQLVDLPQHGQVNFDTQSSNLLYSTTRPDFHGFDTFSYSVITTLSRFNDAINDQGLTTTVRVVSEPPSSPASKSLDSGANSLFSLFMLGLVAFWRRVHRG